MCQTTETVSTTATVDAVGVILAAVRSRFLLDIFLFSLHRICKFYKFVSFSPVIFFNEFSEVLTCHIIMVAKQLIYNVIATVVSYQ